MSKKCICQICTCGRHKCPHNVKPQDGYGDCVFSEYKNQYTEYPVQPRVNFKPEQAVNKSQEPLDDKTIHRTDYVQHPMEKPFKREAERWQKPEGFLESTTNYKNDFTTKPIQSVKMFRPVQAQRNSGKFQGEPTYQADYKSWGPQAKAQPSVPQSQDHTSEEPFDGNTNYKSDYVRHRAAMTKSMKPLENGYKSIDPFDDCTVYKDNYKVHPLEAKSVREKVQWEPNTIPLDDLSNYRKDFTVKEMSKAVTYRPEQTAFQSKSPFDETTTHKLDFVQWPAETRSSYKPMENRYMPDGKMDFDTTTRLDYQAFEPNLVKQPTVRHQEIDSIKQRSGAFDATTHYSNDYKPWSMADRQPVERRKKEDHYVMSDVPFDGQATYKMDFTEKPMTFVKSAKPFDPGFKSQDPLEGMTEYKKEFIQKKPEVCPAGVLTKVGSDHRYTFKEEDDKGHLWYEFRAAVAGGDVVAAA